MFVCVPDPAATTSSETRGPVFSFHPSEETAMECHFLSLSLCVCAHIHFCNVLTLEISIVGVQHKVLALCLVLLFYVYMGLVPAVLPVSVRGGTKVS